MVHWLNESQARQEHAAKAKSKFKLALSPIDLYPMMDKVILHELTHTRAEGMPRM